jgi:hypothetical protein
MGTKREKENKGETMQVELQPWITPNYAHIKMPPGKREDGFKEAPGFALNELDEQTLSDQCDKFRKEIFTKAGKKDPKE